MQDDFCIRRRLTDGATGDQLTAQRQAVGEVAVMSNRDTADFQFGKQRLHVSKRHFAGRRITDVTDGDVAWQFGKRCRVRVVVADEAHATFRMEAQAIEGNDTGSFLATMLKGMQTKRRQRCRIRVPEDAEHAAFFMQRIVFPLIGVVDVEGL